MTLADLVWEPHFAGMGGEHATVEFPNGYGASVIRGGIFYTKGGTYELAVLHGGSLTCETPVTHDVLGYLSENEVDVALAKIEALPPRESEA